jgi:hypothetical protein
VLSRVTLLPTTSAVTTARRRPSMCSISGTERGTTKRSNGRNGSGRAGLALGKHRLGVSSALREDTDTNVIRKQTTMTEEPNRDNGNTTGDLMADGSERLWSNIGTSKSGDNDAPRMVPEPGSLPGAIALVAGTTVGAGMLALPAVCQSSGFVPSTTALVVCWCYMLATGFLVLEVNVSVMRETGSKGASIVTMADRTLGVNGVRFAWCAYVFIHYALLVAYIARAGELIGNALPTELRIPNAVASALYAISFGARRVSQIQAHCLPTQDVNHFASFTRVRFVQIESHETRDVQLGVSGVRAGAVSAAFGPRRFLGGYRKLRARGLGTRAEHHSRHRVGVRVSQHNTGRRDATGRRRGENQKSARGGHRDSVCDVRVVGRGFVGVGFASGRRRHKRRGGAVGRRD